MPVKSQEIKLEKLEAIRGFTAVYVVFYHLFSRHRLVIYDIDLTALFYLGHEAVILFFILSGFVIYYAYEKSVNKSFKWYFLKRFFRIYIPLLLVFISHYLLECAYSRQFNVLDWWNLTGNLLMLQDVTSIKPNALFEPFLDNIPLWSLSYEWWFYLIFYLFQNTFKKKASIIVYILGVLATISYIPYPNFLNRELMYLVIWWVGADMAQRYFKGQDISLKTLKLPLLMLSICGCILFLNIVIKHKINDIKHGLHGVIGFSPWLEFRHFSFALVAILVAIAWK